MSGNEHAASRSPTIATLVLSRPSRRQDESAKEREEEEQQQQQQEEEEEQQQQQLELEMEDDQLLEDLVGHGVSTIKCCLHSSNSPSPSCFRIFSLHLLTHRLVLLTLKI